MICGNCLQWPVSYSKHLQKLYSFYAMWFYLLSILIDFFCAFCWSKSLILWRRLRNLRLHIHWSLWCAKAPPSSPESNHFAYFRIPYYSRHLLLVQFACISHSFSSMETTRFSIRLYYFQFFQVHSWLYFRCHVFLSYLRQYILMEIGKIVYRLEMVCMKAPSKMEVRWRLF